MNPTLRDLSLNSKPEGVHTHVDQARNPTGLSTCPELSRYLIYRRCALEPFSPPHRTMCAQLDIGEV